MPDDGYERYAIYYAPQDDEALSVVGRSWLGIDSTTGKDVKQQTYGLDQGRVHHITAEARRYGLHGTFKAPFRLAPGRTLTNLQERLEGFCRSQPALTLASLRLERLGAFLALMPSGDQRALSDLAVRLVMEFDEFRAPLDEADRARRLQAGLSPVQQQYLDAWGYPYVLDEFRFHITLTGALPESDLATVEQALRDPLAAVLSQPFRVTSLCIFGDPSDGAPFRLLQRYSLAG